MKIMRTAPLVWLLLAGGVTAAPAGPANPVLVLGDGWAIQSSADVGESGAVISTTAFKPANWYRASVPTTVFAALVKLRVYPDPAFGMNLRAVPGRRTPSRANFSNIPAPPESPFRRSWWFRTEFDLPADFQGKTVHLRFDGINYRANVWLNGRQIAGSDEMAGAWRLFAFDVTGGRTPGREERAGRRGLPAAARRPRHHLRRLEPAAARQEHGPVARREPHRHRAGVDRLPARHHEAESARGRQGRTHGHGRVDQRRARGGRGGAQGPDRGHHVRAAGAARGAARPGSSASRPTRSPRSGSPIRACGGPRNSARRTSIRFASSAPRAAWCPTRARSRSASARSRRSSTRSSTASSGSTARTS